MNIVEPIRRKKDIKLIKDTLKKGNFRDYALFIVGINIGLRISDILKLNVGDVKSKNYICIKEQKTNKYKKIPVNDKLKIIFKQLTDGRSNDEPLFKSMFGNRLERTQSYRIINNACKKVGIDYKVGTHTLRKTFGYHHYQKFKDIAILQDIFNHSSQKITLRYIGINQDIIDKSYNNFSL